MDVDIPRRQSTPPAARHAVSNNNNNNHSNHSLSSENSSSETDPSFVSTPHTTQNGSSPLTSAAHSRTQSHAMKRFEPANTQATDHPPLRSKATSVSHPLPINTPFTQHARAQSSVNGLASRDREPPKGLQVVVPAPTQESNFFTALASQERLVLELREELKKAEEYLSKLKKQWLSQEALKRKNETRQMHKMRPLTASLASAPLRKDDVDGSSAWMYQEMERRKALLGNTKPTQRRVFNGSRQLKALSLLSPEKGLLDELPLSAPVDAPNGGDRPSNLLARSFTSPDLAEQVAHEQFINNAHLRTQSNIPEEMREHFIRSSKQIATDFREGLWTFFEDLRQATVGDEVRPLPNGLPNLNSNPSMSKQDLQTRRTNRRASSPNHPARPTSQRPEPLKIETLQPVEEVKSATHSPSFLKEDGDDEQPRSGGRSEKKKSPLGNSSVNKSPGSTSNKSPRSSTHKNYKTPQKNALHTRMYSIEEWGTWNTPSPRAGAGGGTPASTDHRTTPLPPYPSRASVPLPTTYASMPSLANGPGDEVIYNSTVLNGDHPHQIQASLQRFDNDTVTKVAANPNSFASPTPKRLSVLTKPSSDSPRSSVSKRTPLFKESSSESLRSSRSGENRSPTSKSAPRSAASRRTASHMIDEWEKTISMASSPTSTLLEQGTPPMVARTPSPRYRA